MSEVVEIKKEMTLAEYKLKNSKRVRAKQKEDPEYNEKRRVKGNLDRKESKDKTKKILELEKEIVELKKLLIK